MSNLFNFNNFNLSADEVINYAHNGTIDAIPANVFLSIIRGYDERISDTEAEKSQQGYDSGHDHGWAEAIADMREYLSKM